MEPTEAPPEAVVESPEGIETEPVESLEGLEVEVETPEAPAEPADPFADFGGRENIEAAHRLYEATRTTDGQIEVLIQAAQALGVPLSKVQALFDAAEAAEQAEEPDPDEPVTRGDLQAQLRQLQEAEAARRHEAAVSVARKAVADVLKDLNIEPGTPQAKVILTLGDQYVSKDSLDPDEIRNAVRRGHADWQAQLEVDRKAYLAGKREKAATVPSSPSGNAAPSAAPEPEPADVAEAIARARAAKARA